VPIEEQPAFVVYCQDWRGHRFGDPVPPVLQARFDQRAEAEQYKGKLRLKFPDADAVLIRVLPVPAPPAPRKAKKSKRQ